MSANGDVNTTNARLSEAAERGESIEVILVLRGHVRRVAGTGDRWRIRTSDDHVVTFRADAVVATSHPPRPDGAVAANGRRGR